MAWNVSNVNIHSFIGWLGRLVMLIMTYYILDEWEKDIAKQGNHAVGGRK